MNTYQMYLMILGFIKEFSIMEDTDMICTMLHELYKRAEEAEKPTAKEATSSYKPTMAGASVVPCATTATTIMDLNKKADKNVFHNRSDETLSEFTSRACNYMWAHDVNEGYWEFYGVDVTEEMQALLSKLIKAGVKHVPIIDNR